MPSGAHAPVCRGAPCGRADSERRARAKGDHMGSPLRTEFRAMRPVPSGEASPIVAWAGPGAQTRGTTLRKRSTRAAVVPGAKRKGDRVRSVLSTMSNIDRATGCVSLDPDMEHYSNNWLKY